MKFISKDLLELRDYCQQETCDAILFTGENMNEVVEFMKVHCCPSWFVVEPFVKRACKVNFRFLFISKGWMIVENSYVIVNTKGVHPGHWANQSKDFFEKSWAVPPKESDGCCNE